MYIIPKPYICPTCKTKTYQQEPDTSCMKCFADFIARHVPKVVPDPGGEPYNQVGRVTYD